MSAGVMVAYNGVHQAYQIALAANEAGVLDKFVCSFIDAPGRWGGMLARIAGSEKMRSYRAEGLPADRITEFPWPTVLNTVKSKLRLESEPPWVKANEWFDRWAAKKVKRSKAAVFVGAETCARDCFAAAADGGLVRVLDLPSLHPSVVEQALDQARQETGVNAPARLDPPGLAQRKREELETADWLLVYSEVHRRSYASAGYGSKSFFECPLWVDADFWSPEPERQVNVQGPLRVLFAGSITLQKGIPYLLRAVELCANRTELTLVGRIHSSLLPHLESRATSFNHIAPVPKAQLRRIYCEHDLLVLPSLADSFGFVAMEAMACGLPVVVTDNCGAPVPDSAWRVPVMNAEAIARRLDYYESDRAALQRDSAVAVQFARQFTPQRYRAEIKTLFTKLLSR